MWIARIKFHWYTHHKIYRFHGVIGGMGQIYWFCAIFFSLKFMCFLIWKLQVTLREWDFCGTWIARAKLHWYTFHMVYSFHGLIWHVGCIYWFWASFGPFPPPQIHAFPNKESGGYTLGWDFFQIWVAGIEAHIWAFHMVYRVHVAIEKNGVALLAPSAVFI